MFLGDNSFRDLCIILLLLMPEGSQWRRFSLEAEGIRNVLLIIKHFWFGIVSTRPEKKIGILFQINFFSKSVDRFKKTLSNRIIKSRWQCYRTVNRIKLNLNLMSNRIKLDRNIELSEVYSYQIKKLNQKCNGNTKHKQKYLFLFN